MYNKGLQTFYKASIISFFSAIIIGGFSFMYGKEKLFLLLNTDLGTIGDYIFNYATYLADGVVWVPFVIWVFVKKRSNIIVTIFSIIITTVIAQGIKRYVLPIEPRPIVAITNRAVIHTIGGVEVAEVGSFPSGHTTQIFAMFLLLCICYSSNWLLWIGFITSMFVAYSRVYQAQHFPIDVAGGIVAALISVWSSYFIQIKIQRKKQD